MREPKTGKKLPKAINEEDMEMLREECETPFEHAVIETFYNTGCRIGEIYLLNRRDIDWERRAIIVTGKGDKEREVYFTVKASIWLKKYLQTRLDDIPALFVTRRKFKDSGDKPRRMSIAQLRYVIKGIADRAEIETNVYPHRLRHTFATHLLNNGAPLEMVSEQLGHSRVDVTRVYAFLSGERRRGLYNRYM